MSATTQAGTNAVYNDSVVRWFAVASVVYGVVGMLVGVIIAAQLTWPELNMGIEWLTYGRLRPLHTNAVIFAFCGSVLFATSYYVMHLPDHAVWWQAGMVHVHWLEPRPDRRCDHAPSGYHQRQGIRRAGVAD